MGCWRDPIQPVVWRILSTNGFYGETKSRIVQEDYECRMASGFRVYAKISQGAFSFGEDFPSGRVEESDRVRDHEQLLVFGGISASCCLSISATYPEAMFFCSLFLVFGRLLWHACSAQTRSQDPRLLG